MQSFLIISVFDFSSDIVMLAGFTERKIFYIYDRDADFVHSDECTNTLEFLLNL